MVLYLLNKLIFIMSQHIILAMKFTAIISDSYKQFSASIYYYKYYYLQVKK